MRSTLRRAAVVSASCALLLTGTLGAPAVADPSPSGTAGSGWIAGKLVDGRLFPEGYNNGFNIDAGLAELAMGDTATAGRIRDALASSINDYIAFESGDPGSTYAGPTAKALSFVVQSGGNPRSFGGVDLVSRLEATVTTGGAQSGRIRDISAFGDFANTVGQSFAASGLTAVGSTKAPAVRAFLLAQQCPNGQFRLSFSDPADAQQSCVANPSGPAGPDVTAYAVLGLQSQYGDPVVKAAIDKAVAWLRSVQAADGSFTDEDGKANSNSTGLAGLALGRSCATDAADRAAAWIRTVQVPAGQAGALAGEVGAVAYGPAEFAAARSGGITDMQQWKVSTSQATPALGWDAAAKPTVSLTGPKRFVKSGTRVYVTVTGAADGERFCLGDGTTTRALDGIGAPLTVPIDLPRKGGPVTVTATTGPGRAVATFEALGKAKLKLALPGSVERGSKVTAAVKGFASHERVRLLVDGKVVAKGKANRKGRFVGRFVASFAPGVHKLLAVGAFKFRKSGETFRVVA